MSNWTYEIDDGLVTFYEDGIQASIDKVFDALNAAESRIAELEAFIDQLIEAGNELTANPAFGNYEEREAAWTKLWLKWKARNE